jgi:CPA2 family monovalent cation:H+ antiporter-2
MHTVKAARQAYPDLPIFARSRDEHHARELREAGATAVVPETLEAGLQLSSFALHVMGLSDSAINAALQTERESRVRA